VRPAAADRRIRSAARRLGQDVRDPPRPHAHLRRARARAGCRCARHRPVLRRQQAADRDSLPPRGRRRRHRRLRPRDQRLPPGGQALAADARGARVRAQAIDEAVLDAFCDALWLEDGLSKNTISSYRADLLQLGAFLKKDFLKVGEADLFAFLGSRKGRASSAARRVSTLKRFYQYCLRERRLKIDPTKRTPRFPKSLSEADVEALLAAPNTATLMGLRDRAMLELLYATGL